jgi:hypothetical protein
VRASDQGDELFDSTEREGCSTGGNGVVGVGTEVGFDGSFAGAAVTTVPGGGLSTSR